MTIAAILLCLLLTACGTTAPSDADKGPDLVFPITANVADRILLDAMRPELGSADIVRITAPHMGYKATTVSADNSFAVLAFRIPARGQRRSGATVPCFYFEVDGSSGSADAEAAADRVRTRILAAARREAGALPMAPAAEATPDRGN